MATELIYFSVIISQFQYLICNFFKFAKFIQIIVIFDFLRTQMRFSYFILCRYLIIQNPKQISESQYYERLSVKIFSHSCFCFTLCFFALFSSNLSVFICFKSFSSSPPSFAGAGLKTLSLRRLTTRGFLAPLPVVPLQPAATEHSVSTYPSQRAT